VKAVSGDATMSRETDKLMLKLPLADVAEWLRQELEDHAQPKDVTDAMDEMAHLAYLVQTHTLLRLIAKLGH
jgi:hypothetical protein